MMNTRNSDPRQGADRPTSRIDIYDGPASSADNWRVTVVAPGKRCAREYQTRANGRCGVIHVDHDPTAVDDPRSTTQNAIGALRTLSVAG